ncbi:uncharacterized protein LY79DRAFT_584464 [Colletotrichum navitas]|uniref:Uncharacterized protein n=1 Tax=Colletotrichum navitas TaxID=681940 RepID=A0AAD8PLK6_9PEZI|nr:uncharacterized protein LY79DRAFT_584464 [Colletotrichum navitas]KAK1569811.1 hypothetical protein LY79DRAFT_584464 [Colletotrichum navitas]
MITFTKHLCDGNNADLASTLAGALEYLDNEYDLGHKLLEDLEWWDEIVTDGSEGPKWPDSWELPGHFMTWLKNNLRRWRIELDEASLVDSNEYNIIINNNNNNNNNNNINSKFNSNINSNINNGNNDDINNGNNNNNKVGPPQDKTSEQHPVSLPGAFPTEGANSPRLNRRDHGTDIGSHTVPPAASEGPRHEWQAA